MLAKSFFLSEMQSKLNLSSETAKIAELKINIRKTNTLRLNANAELKFLIYGKDIDDVINPVAQQRMLPVALIRRPT